MIVLTSRNGVRANEKWVWLEDVDRSWNLRQMCQVGVVGQRESLTISEESPWWEQIGQKITLVKWRWMNKKGQLGSRLGDGLCRPAWGDGATTTEVVMTVWLPQNIVAESQGADGLWNSSVLAASFPLLPRVQASSSQRSSSVYRIWMEMERSGKLPPPLLWENCIGNVSVWGQKWPPREFHTLVISKEGNSCSEKKACDLWELWNKWETESQAQPG